VAEQKQFFKVLVIDDVPTVHLTVQAALEDTCDVRCVDNGEAGAAMAREWSPDVILCDMLMPGINGWETIIQLKMQEQTRTVPIILLTGVAEEAKDFPALKDQVAGILAKPFDAKELRKMVASLLPEAKPINPSDPAVPPE
jgi:CheY-like chemotaxis protein